jgi:hypothetical protein
VTVRVTGATASQGLQRLRGYSVSGATASQGLQRLRGYSVTGATASQGLQRLGAARSAGAARVLCTSAAAPPAAVARSGAKWRMGEVGGDRAEAHEEVEEELEERKEAGTPERPWT